MARTSYSAKAPGTLMLCGEHAVLQDKRAIVFAIDKWIKITLIPRLDFRVVIQSSLGKRELELNEITIQKPFTFVFATILHFKEQLASGFELIIDSDFREDVGLGSSAAVTVAMVSVLYQFIDPHPALTRHPLPQAGEGNKTISPLPQGERVPEGRVRVFETAKAIIKRVQGLGSGADVAASVYGGGIVYQQKPPYVLKQLPYLLPLTVVYSGSKMPTTEVVQKVEALQKKYPAVFQAIYEAIDEAISETLLQIEKEDWSRLGDLLNIQQGFMNALGVGTPVLNQIIDTLNQNPHIYGAKISGSGLGDCVIGIGKGNVRLGTRENSKICEIPLSVSLVGVSDE